MNKLLLLQTPEQHQYDNPAVELNPKRVAKQLKQLPLLNLVASLKELLDAVGPCNLQRMPAKTRIRLLELYRNTAVAIFPSAEDEHLHKLPLGGAQRKQVKEDLGRLCLALADGYKILVREGQREGQDPRRNPILLLAAYRALEMLVLALLHAYRTYDPVPPFAFLEAHQLYGFAEQHGILSAEVVFEKEVVSRTGMESLYKHLLLLAITDPFHFTTGTTSRIHQLLAAYAPGCLIQPFQTGPAQEGRFVIDLEGDSPPLPCARLEGGLALEQPRLLDARPALEQAMKRMKELHAASQGTKVPNEELQLLAVLLPELEKTRVRQTPRKAVRREARVTFGIEAVHYFLSRGSRHLLPDAAANRAGIQVQDLESEEDGNYAIEPWLIINESVNGFMLTSRRKFRADVRVGATAGIVLPTNGQPPRLSIAVVRWMRNTRDERIEIGVEVIPGDILPVTCRPADLDAARFGEHFGLFLPSVSALSMPATLMTPKKVYSRDRMIEVHTGEKSLTVQAGHLVMDTAHFDRFEFLALGES